MSQKVINLLPKSRLKDLYQEMVFHRLLSAVWLSVFSFVVVIGVQVYAQFELQRRVTDYQGRLDQVKQQVNKKENSDLKAQIKGVNNLIADYKNMGDATPKFSKVLMAFSVLPPDSVSISSLVIDPTKKTVVVSGFSPTRDAVLDFYKAIKNDTKNFKNVDYPLQHIVRPTEVPFQFTFSINDELLK
ncbi:MAG: hypothetical protein M1333_02955 [Patescibacteria group bacterium]|nr:hypothetical protein [Patescibacteria group bacterium]